jgi:hypothetical protein
MLVRVLRAQTAKVVLVLVLVVAAALAVLIRAIAAEKAIVESN